ncbi:LRR domain containing protein [Parasponia andersonii]|uniref:LRR domain containing protein n=1 Tax=Parasponia andersonii TaxID=3476 RepID=A0A2P5A9Z4_PARAD|nr:LRR domain containing protein [Parasponia andersonii]
MIASESLFIAVASWATIVFILVSNVENMILVTAISERPSPELEAKALLQTEWWSNEYNSSSPCKWPGVTCNHAGRATDIVLRFYEHEMYNRRREFGKFNFSSFPNLARLSLVGLGLVGHIPAEISTLSKLTHLDLSANELTGQLTLSLTSLPWLKIILI